MRSDVKSELQMLREFFWFHAPQVLCRFCGLPLLSRPVGMAFGHRRHPKVQIRWTLHHEDKNRDNNADSNLKDSHSECHKEHHAVERQKEGADGPTQLVVDRDSLSQ